MKTETVVNKSYLNKKGKKLNVQLFSSHVAAGFPVPGDADIEESLDINDLLVKNPSATFFVRVEGDSMEGVGIFSGDVLAVDRSIESKDGKIVVAAVFGELVVKRLKINKSGTWLISENKNYEPINISSNDDCFIWGAVTGSIRQF